MPNDEAVNAVDKVRHASALQLAGMAKWATDFECRKCLHSIADTVENCFATISQLAQLGQFRPVFKIALEEGDSPGFQELPPLRIGFYALAANPMHWGHILVGLTAMATMRLDKVIFIIAGADERKPTMVSAETRHRLSRSVLETFHPLFAYCPIALGTNFDGERNFGRLLELNLLQPMEAFYIAGGDHYRRTTPQGEPDTIQKLEMVVEAQQRVGAESHAISVVFVDREAEMKKRDRVDTFLNIHVLPPIPLSFSSTAARKALCKDAFCVDLVSLPYSCLLEIRTDGLYSGKAECLDQLESPI